MTARLSLFHTETLFFSFKIHCVQMLQFFQTKKGSFFHRHACIQWLHSFSLYNALYTLVMLFSAPSEDMCPIHYIVHNSSQSVSHWNSVFSFKIHCLQMLQLFQTKKVSFFFIVTLVYSGCIAFPYIMHCIYLSLFLAASPENMCPMYYIVHSSSQSVSHLNFVLSFKIHCLQMLQFFQTKKGSFFSLSRLYTVVA